MDGRESDKGLNQQQDQEPEVVVTTLNGESLPSLRLNLTPDSYNGLVNMYSVLSPEYTKAEVVTQFKEKQSILRESSFKRTMPTLGVRETRWTNNWQNYFVVFSGSYIYFYKEEQDLMPYHYLYAVSISASRPTAQWAASAFRARRLPDKDPGTRAKSSSEQESGSTDQAPNKRTAGNQHPKSTISDKSTVDNILVLRGGNQEQIFLNFGKTHFDHRRRGSSSSSSGNPWPSQHPAGQVSPAVAPGQAEHPLVPRREAAAPTTDAEAAAANSSRSKPSQSSKVSSSMHSRSGSRHSRRDSRGLNPSHRKPELMESEQARIQFQNLINSKQ